MSKMGRLNAMMEILRHNLTIRTPFLVHWPKVSNLIMVVSMN